MRDFINENSITFEQGERNTNCVVLVGYAQHKGLTELQLIEELKEEIKDDSFIEDEVKRLWNYCENKNYSKFWESEEAKMQYTF